MSLCACAWLPINRLFRRYPDALLSICNVPLQYVNTLLSTTDPTSLNDAFTLINTLKRIASFVEDRTKFTLLELIVLNTTFSVPDWIQISGTYVPGSPYNC